MAVEMDDNYGCKWQLTAMEMVMDKQMATTMEGNKLQGRTINEQTTGQQKQQSSTKERNMADICNNNVKKPMTAVKGNKGDNDYEDGGPRQK